MRRRSASRLSAAGWRSSRRRGTLARQRRHRIDAQTVELVRVDRLIANPLAILVHVPERLLKQARLRIPLRNGGVLDIELVFMHGDIEVGSGLIGGVGQLKLMSFDEILPVP